MEVANNSWQIVGTASSSTLTIQNVGTCRIAYTFASSQPATDDIALDSDEHYILGPGEPEFTVSGSDLSSQNMYVRALGPISGKLAVRGD